ncbi:DUF4209 domain-containing protein [Proteus mirabilis]|uniref:DUF4209 domain-containing protein n=1 Tax=Proteus mirabilis TaxID=584 RepID=UPI0019CF89F1|nr:DUF4209 domain-containing protein [Proteus mirabilis]MBN7188469.1 DUF4209 domain-containing protein [Proteus mirabilis]MBN7242608.1 DUF4209 domain-containing protein [Proteus mirabilis]HEJ1043699.1 DUF4209 domain-containing protein [Proteus mirabilis]
MLSFFEEGVNYSNNTLLTNDNFINFDYARLQTVNLQYRDHYNLKLIYNDIINGNDINKKYILNLFLFLVHLDYSFKNKNFKSYTLGDGNDDILHSITEVDIDNLIIMVDNIQYPTLKFKAYDFISSRRRKEKLKYINLALNEAINFNLKHEEWHYYYGIAMKKAANISNLNNPDIKILSNKLTNKIINIITDETKGKIPYDINYNWCFTLFTFLHTTQITEYQNWIPIFNSLIEKLIETNNINQAKDYLDLLSCIYRKEKNEHLEYYTYKRIGDLYYDLASKSTGIESLFLFNISLLYFRKIPKKDRDTFNINEKIKKIELSLQPEGRNTIDNLKNATKNFKFPREYTEYVNYCVEQIRNKSSFLDQFCSLLFMDRTIKKSNILEEAKKQANNAILRHLSVKVNLAKDGRVINRIAPLNLHGDSMDTNDYTDDCFMIIKIQTSLTEHLIISIIDEINKKYNNTVELENSINYIIEHSLFVPTERQYIFKKIITLGLKKDFSTAIYLLCPQLENFFRSILKYSNVSTTTINSDHEEMEAGLSTLLDKKEACDIFDENLLFEMKMLFTESGGPNLRNEVAHGLLDDIDAMQPIVTYAWWRFVRLIVDGCFCKITDSE